MNIKKFEDYIKEESSDVINLSDSETGKTVRVEREWLELHGGFYYTFYVEGINVLEIRQGVLHKLQKDRDVVFKDENTDDDVYAEFDNKKIRFYKGPGEKHIFTLNIYDIERLM